MERMEQLPLVAFRGAVLPAANGEEGSLRWDGLMDNQLMSSHSQGSAAKHRDIDRPPRETDRQTDEEHPWFGVPFSWCNCSSKLWWTEVIDKQQK